MKKEYYLGLDIGTNSVGWAVTDTEYNLCKFRKKDLWGIRLFEDASTAENRRMKRAGRRRLERRKQRIDLLQEIFAEEITKVDETFFIRLNESRLHLEDKTAKVKHPLFNDKDYTDIDYYKQYPTIFHLRKALICENDNHDIRLVYLALHHILKNRGHFLIEGNLSEAKDFKTTFNSMREKLHDEFGIDFYITEENLIEFEAILRSKEFAKSVKVSKLKALLEIDTSAMDKDEVKAEKAVIDNLCKFIVGNAGDLKKLLKSEVEGVEKSKFSFADAKYEESIRDEIETAMPEKFYAVESIKALYDWSILADILNDEDYISFAKVKQYEEHQKNLYMLRGIVMKYCNSKTYQEFFNDHSGKKANYASYIGSVKKNGKRYDVKHCSEEDFYKELNNLLKKITVKDEDRETLEYLMAKSDTYALLPLQRSKDNGVVPKQVHEIELKAILKNAAAYLPFLNEKDESGFTAAEKIESIFSYRVPYYVGPLSDRHKAEGANVWIVRKEEGRIYPWNFEQKVDLKASNVEFIKRMTNKCTYLLGEDVLPKNSLLYSKYMVLNELNNLKIRGHKISVELKQDIYENLFMKKSKVKGETLLNYLNQKDPGANYKAEDLSGFDIDFKASLTSWLDFEKKVFGERIAEPAVQKMVEDIIKWKTIYGKDKKMLKEMIDSKYPGQLNEQQFKAISKFTYSGWGNFSEKFLNGIEGVDLNPETTTGEVKTVIRSLWETNNNLMQILSGNFSFKKEIDAINAEHAGKIKDFSYDNLVRDLYVSPANKRAIWQTVQITEEIKKVMGAAPAKIFVEMARGGEKEKERKKSRKQQLLDLYSACEGDVREWIDEIENTDERKFNSMKLFLYYTQMGKCMYTGETIDLYELMSANSKWDRDHIYPQSKIKDDSINNLVLVNKTVNSKKDNELLSGEIVKARREWWKELLRLGFITKKKYDRLTRTSDFTEDELAGFISRQLVETRQSSKAVAELLDRMYEDTEIVYVKAGLVSQFRQKDLCMLKSRRVNDYHHAKDAYLNIVVGNVYNAKFTSNPLKWMRENRNTNYSINKVFYYDFNKKGQAVWVAPDKDEAGKAKREQQGGLVGGTIDTVRSVMQKNDILYTEYTYCGKGELFNATLAKKGNGSNIQLKAGLDTEKYGGYISPNTSYFALIEFDDKKGERCKNIIGVPIYIANMLEHKPDAFIKYCEEVQGYKNVKIIHEKIKKNSLLIVDGFPMRIRGENKKNNMFKGNLQLILKNEETVRLIEKYIEKRSQYNLNPELDGLSRELLDNLFVTLIEKMKSIYAKRPVNITGKIESLSKAYYELDLTSKAVFLNELLTIFRCDIKTDADTTLIGGVAHMGKLDINKNTIGNCKIVLINESVTGIFKNRIEL